MNRAVRCARLRSAASRLGLAAVLTVGLGAFGTAFVLRSPHARADEVTASQTNLRTGWDQNEPSLSPAVVGGGSFGELFSTAVNGQVYAQPVVAGSTVIVATLNDWVYGLDAVTGAVKWSVSLGTPWPSATAPCSDINPNVGVLSTPVYDPGSGLVYLVAEVVPAGSDNYHPAFYVHALNAQTGAEQPSWPVQIKGAPVNDPTRPFNPFTEWQRPGLLLTGGSVYAAFASHCDQMPYDGYVVGMNTSTRAQTMWTDESGVTDTEAGIWQSGGGLMSDGAGRIFLTSGNGVSPAAGPGSQPPSELAESTVRLNVQSGGTLSAVDYYSPADAPTLDANDRDFGSGGPVGLPFGSTSYPDLLVQAGKDGHVLLLNRDNLGGREQGPNGSDAFVSQAGPYQGQWGHPAAFGDTATVTSSNASTANDFVYYVGSGDYLRALKFGLNSSGTPVLTDVANSTSTFGFASGSPVVTSNGTDPSSAVVWEVYSSGASGTGGMLEAFDAVPPSSCTSSAPCALTQIWSAPIGTASKFSIPATDSGRVYVGTRDGNVIGFGSPSTAPVGGASPVAFGQVSVGSTSPTQSVTVTANTTVTITGVSTTSTSGTNPFTAGAPTQNGNPVSLPVTLNTGDTLTVPVTFAPTAPGGVTGALAFASSYPNFPSVGVGLSGTGTQAGFYAKPGSVSLGSLPVGTSASAQVVITNGGTTSETVSSVTQPNAPFSVTGLPSGTIPAGASVSATVTYQPTAVESDSSQFTINDSDGTSLTVNLSGSGIADVSQFTATPTSVSFGSVPLGTQATQTIDIANTGNLPATISVSPPSAPFGAPDPISANLPVNPGYDLNIPVTFTPTSIGSVTNRYKVTWTDALGAHTLTVPISATGVAPASGIAVPPPGGGWILNGNAQMSGSSLALNQAVTNQAGDAIYSSKEPSNGLQASFTVSLGGGTGADGMTFALLNSKDSQTAVGGTGAQLGFGGMAGIAVALDTHKAAGYPSSNFVGIATGASNGVLTFAATSTNIPNLRSGTHVIGVSVSGQTVTITVDGTQVLSKTLPSGTVPSSVYPAFTGATGGLTDIHTVSQASITAGGNPIPAPGGGWSYNGTAIMSHSDNVLTRATSGQTGSVVYPTPVNTAGLQVTFDAQLSGGATGNGLTFALLDPSQATQTALGGGGGELGFGGLAGVAFTMVTYQSTGYPSNNFVAISAGTTNSLLTFQTFTRQVSHLRTGTHTITVQVANGDDLIVALDGEQIFAQAEPGLTATSLLAFTAATGSSQNEQHTVRSVAISATG